MINIVNIKNRKPVAILCMIVLLISAFLFGKIQNVMIKNYIFMLGMFGLFVFVEMWIFLNRKTFSMQKLVQLLPISIIAALFWNLAVVSKYTIKTHYVYMITGELLVNAFWLELVLILLDRESIINVWQKIKNRWDILIICAIFIICTLPTLDSWLGLDGVIYYQSLRSIREWDFVNVFGLKMCGHVSQGYSVFALIGEYLFPDKVIGARIANIVLALVTIYAFYKIIEKVLANASRLEKSLCTSLFAFSPILMGMIQEINLDFPVLCFFTWFVCAYLYNCEIWIIASSVLLCFSKEPAVILYGMFILGVMLGRIAKQIKVQKALSLIDLVTRDIVFAVSGGILWIAFYFGNSSGWTENVSNDNGTGKDVSGTILNTFDIDLQYIVVRLKQMFLINFSWLLVVVSLIGIIAVLIFKRRMKKTNASFELIFGVFLSFIGFLICSCFYITWIHYRYLMAILFFAAFLFVIVYGCLILDKTIKLSITCMLVSLIFVSNYLTIDPLSVRNFNFYKTGKNVIIVPCVMSANDKKVINVDRSKISSFDINNAALYNFEWSYFGKAFDNMLDELNYDSDKLILIHDESDRINCYFGIYGKLTDTLYWNDKSRGLNINTYYLHEGDEYQVFNIELVSDDEALQDLDLSDYKEVYLLDMDITEDIDEADQYEHYETYEYAMWSWEIYKIK